MARSNANAVYICGGRFESLQDRGDCPNPLHDWPLPEGYVEASEVADSRLAHGWSNEQCPDCLIYGWVMGSFRGLAATSVRVRAEVSS